MNIRVSTNGNGQLEKKTWSFFVMILFIPTIAEFLFFIKIGINERGHFAEHDSFSTSLSWLGAEPYASRKSRKIYGMNSLLDSSTQQMK